MVAKQYTGGKQNRNFSAKPQRTCAQQQDGHQRKRAHTYPLGTVVSWGVQENVHTPTATTCAVLHRTPTCNFYNTAPRHRWVCGQTSPIFLRQLAP